MLDHALWSNEFANVVSCSRCTTTTCKNLLRDLEENVPQPGFIGTKYYEERVLLFGQNPAITKSEQALAANRPYTAKLEHVFGVVKRLWGQGALPRSGQERHARIHCPGADQSLPEPTTTDGTGAVHEGGKRAVRPDTPPQRASAKVVRRPLSTQLICHRPEWAL